MSDTRMRELLAQFEAIRDVHYGAAVIDKSDVDRQIGHAWDRAVRMLRAAFEDAHV